MHDIASLDKRGVAGCAVASEEFQVGAAVQAKALGLEPAIVWVPHPIQNRLADELAAIADAAIAPILERISRVPAAG